MTEDTPAPGRPKSEAASTALKEAALKLVDAEGYGVSISAIIREAGVSRQTLYNRWPTKAELVLDALFERAGVILPAPDLTGPEPRQHLLASYLRRLFAQLGKDADLLRSLIAEAQTDPAFRKIFHERLVAPRVAIVEELLRDAQSHGELDPASDTDLTISMIYGAFWYRLLLDLPLTPEVADGLAAELFRRAP